MFEPPLAEDKEVALLVDSVELPEATVTIAELLDEVAPLTPDVTIGLPPFRPTK